MIINEQRSLRDHRWFGFGLFAVAVAYGIRAVAYGIRVQLGPMALNFPFVIFIPFVVLTTFLGGALRASCQAR